MNLSLTIQIFYGFVDSDDEDSGLYCEELVIFSATVFLPSMLGNLVLIETGSTCNTIINAFTTSIIYADCCHYPVSARRFQHIYDNIAFSTAIITSIFPTLLMHK